MKIESSLFWCTGVKKNLRNKRPKIICLDNKSYAGTATTTAAAAGATTGARATTKEASSFSSQHLENLVSKFLRS